MLNQGHFSKDGECPCFRESPRFAAMLFCSMSFPNYLVQRANLSCKYIQGRCDAMFITREHFERALRNKSREPWKTYYSQLEMLCEKLLAEDVPERLYNPGRSLFRVRFVSRAIISLCGMYRLTGKSEYAERAWYFARTAMNWDDMWHVQGTEKVRQFDLNTSEIAFPFAFLLYWLEEYNDKKRADQLIDWVDKYVFTPYLEAVSSPKPEERAWWYESTINWNSVCNGGLLCLALTLENRLNKAKESVPLALKGLDAYIDALHPDGSYPEGTGYWQYGNIFLFYGLRWYEAAKGEKHRAFDLNCFNDGMSFVFDFSPNGTALSFGDCNFFNPIGGIFTLTERTGRKDTANRLTHRIMKWIEKYPEPPVFLEETIYMRAHEIFALLCCDAEYDAHIAEEQDKGPAVAIYKDNGWGIFRSNGISVALRSGSSRVNHGMRDLNSIQLEKNGVRLLENKAVHPYPRAWFGPTRNHYFEDSTLSKNSMIIDGLGQLKYGEAEWGTDGVSMWSDAAKVYPEYVRKAYRKISIEEEGIVLEDEFEVKPGQGVSWPEIRFLTPGCFEKMAGNTWKVSKDGVSVLISISGSEELDYMVCDAPGSLLNQPVYQLLRISTRRPVEKCSFRTVFKNCV